MTLFATCARGLADVLREEVAALGLEAAPAAGESGVHARGGLAEAMRLNLHLRTAHRVLMRVGRFAAATPDDLHAAAVRLPWEDWLRGDVPFTVRASVRTPAVRDSRYGALKLKDAVADRLRARLGRRPDSGPRTAGAALFLRWEDERADVYLDTTGVSLSHRGYRRAGLAAPLRESLAAGIVLATGWDGSAPFVNPMCGSGTLAIEAALIALHRAPALARSDFAFLHLRGHDPDAWEAVRREARARLRPAPASRLVAADRDPGAVAAARRNARAAGVEPFIEWKVCDFADTPVPPGRPCIVLNPEYGERMGEEDELIETYRRIGRFFRAQATGGAGYLFTGNLRLSRRIGLKAGRIRTLFNGPIECRLLEFPIYGRERGEGAANRASGP